MRKLSKNRLFTGFVAFTTILWTIGIVGVLTPLFTAQAAVTVVSESFVMGSWMMGSNMMSTVAAFKITGSAGETLNSIKVRFEDVGSSGATPSTILAAFNATGAGGANDAQGMCIYKDANSNGWMDPGASSGDTVLAWENQPTWTDNGNGTYDTILDIANDALPSSYTGSYNYFVHIKMASAPAAAKSFKFSFATGAGNAIVTSGTSPSITAFTTNAINSMGSGGQDQVAPPHVTNLYYKDYKTLIIDFDTDMNQTSVECTGADCANKYTLDTKNATDNETIASAARHPSDFSKVILTANNDARISISPEDKLIITTNAQYAPKALSSGMYFSDTYPMMATITPSFIKLTEIKISGAQATDEFIEIENTTSSPISINGYTIGALTQNGTIYATLATAANVSLNAGQYYLFANQTNNFYQNVNGLGMAADQPFTAGGINLSNADTVFLLDSAGMTLDLVGLGNPAKVYEMSAISGSQPANGSFERKATYQSLNTTMVSADAAKANAYDSNQNSYDFVLRDTADPEKSTSTLGIIPQQGGYQNSLPMIEHMPVSMASANQQLTIPAKIMDQEDAFSQFTTVSLCYKAGNVSWPESPTCVAGTMVYQVNFNVPASVVTTNGLDYYIYVKDSMNGEAWSSANPSANTVALAKASPYHLTVSSTTGSRKISGTVYQSNCSTAISGATVFVEGAGYSAMTDGSGIFTFNGLTDGVYNLSATAGGYIEGNIWGVSVNSNNPQSTGWTFCLQTGNAGQGGDSDAPQIIKTAPMEGMMGAPLDIVYDRAPILVYFDQEIDTTSALCTNCDAASANIKFKKIVGGTPTNITGYNVGVDTGSGVSGTQFGGSSTKPIVVLWMVPLLVKQTDYVVEITSAVKDLNGNPVDGNKPGGGHSFMFTTQGTDFTFSGSSGGFGFTENESFWQTGNFASMTQDSNYQTMMTKFDSASGEWQGGQFNPPYIFGVTPNMGQSSVALNLDAIIVEFNEAMDSNSINKGAINLFTVNNGTTTDVTITKVNTISLSSDKKFVIVDLVDNALTASVQYRLKIKNGVRGMSGLTIGPPADPGGYFYESDFTASASLDLSAATIASSYPDNNATNVAMGLGVIDVMFNKALNPTNINSTNVTLKAGTMTVPTTMKYDSMSRKISLFPSSGLTPGVKYTVSFIMGGTTGIKDYTGLPSAETTYTRSFTISTTIDTTSPRVEFANCDTYGCAITFSKTMNALNAADSASNANKWTSSVLNPSSYAITFGPTLGTETAVNTSATGVTVGYDNYSNTVMLDGLTFTGATANTDWFVITVSNAKDIMDNPIETNKNVAKGMLMSASDTAGFKGPGTGGFMGSGAMASGGPSDFGNFKPQEAMMMGANVMPMNMMAGATTTFFIDFPVSPSGKASQNKLDNGAYLKFTFPQGFNVANVIPDPYNPAKNDLNWGGPSTVVLKTSGVTDDGSSATTKGGAANDGVTVSGQTVTVWLNTGGGTTGDPDFFHFELKGIVNTSAVQDFNTDGYSLDLKAYKADGNMTESKTSMPFFINSAGTNNITINITAADGNGDILLMMGGPQTGPMDSTVTVSAGAASKSWQNLPNGCYHIFTEPTITLGANKYTGQNKPEPLCLPGSGANWNSGTSTLTVPLTFTKLSAANSASLTVKISGTFNASGESVDIFAGGPNSFVVETKTLTGAVTNNSTTLMLPQNGSYMIGIGPAMPKGPMMGPPPMPDWMPPMNVNIQVSGIGGTPVIKRSDTNATITELSFTVNTASKQIIGRVISKETTLASAYSANATTVALTSGTSFVAGDLIVLYDGTNADVARITSISGNNAVIDKGINRSYIAGKTVYNIISNANVWANQPMGFGGKGAYVTSDSAGAFTLKVASNGAYEVGAMAPGIGDSPSRTAIVSDNNAGTADSNSTADVKVDGKLVTTSSPFLIKMFKPGYSISGKVMDLNNNPIQYSHVMAEEATSHHFVHSGTDSNGAYVLSVDIGTWNIIADMPPSTDACGTITKTITIDANTGSKEFQNLVPGSATCYTISGTITIAGTAQANIPVMLETWDTVNNRPSGGYHRNEMTDQNGAYKIKAGNGIYRLSTWSPDYGEVGTSVTVNGGDQTANITYALNALKTLTISFTGGTNSMHGFMEAKSITNPTRRGMPLPDLSQNATMSLPADTYKVMVFVDGLGDFSPASNVDLTTANQAVAVSLTGQVLNTLSGTILDNSNNPVSGAAIVVVEGSTGLAKETTTDANGDYSMQITSGNYTVRADHKNYSSPAAATVSVTGNVNYDFDSNTSNEDVQVDNDLVAKSVTISGTVNNSSGAAMTQGGYVLATTATGEKAKAAIQQDGTYSLPVSPGTWTVKADGPLHALTTLGSTVAITDSAVTNTNITMTADATDVKKAETRSVSAAGGLTVDDTENTGVKFVAGSGVIGRGSTSQLSFEEVDAPVTDTLTPVGNFVEVTAKLDDNDVSQLTGDGAEIVFTYTAADLTAAGITNEALLKLSYYDETTDSYMPLSNQVCDATNNVCTGTITHLTSIGITKPSSAASTTRRTITSDVVTTTVEEKKTAEKKVTTEEKKVEVKEVKAEEKAVVTLVETTKVEVKEVAKKAVEAAVVLTNVKPVLPETRDLNKEMKAIGDFATINKKAAPKAAVEWDAVKYIAYGTTDKTKSMTMAERKDLLTDYKAVYGKLPSSEKDWTNLGKIAQGVTPTRVLSKEVQALKAFTKIFGRMVKFSDNTNEQFVHMLAYRLEPTAKDTVKEKAAVSKYVEKYKVQPKDNFAWAVVNAIAYAGVPEKVEKKTEKAIETPKTETKPAAPAVEIPNAVPKLPAAELRNLKAETSALKDYVALSGKAPDDNGWKVVNFVAYGSSDASKVKTAKSRLTVLKQYKAKYGKLPVSDADWQTVAGMVK